MSSSAEPLDPVALAQVHRLALQRLREMAMDLADRLHASADEPGADVGEVASKFARVARAVRQTIALESRLADEERRRAEADARAAAERAKAEAQEEQQRRWAEAEDEREERQEIAEKRLEVVTVLQRAFAHDIERERLEERLYERLTDRDAYDVVIMCQSVPQAIRYICRDLRFTPDWQSLTDRDWKLAEDKTRRILLGEPVDDDEGEYDDEEEDAWDLAP